MADDPGPRQGPVREPELDTAAMKAFTHPLRLRMFQELQNRGPATATHLAERLGENTAQTSYHLRQLARHGIVTEDTTLGTGRERWWRAAGFSMQRDGAGEGPGRVLLSAMVQERARVLQSWLEDEDLPEEWREASLDQSTTVILTAAELAAMNREVQQVIDRHAGAGAGREPELTAGSSDLRRVRVYYDSFPLPT